MPAVSVVIPAYLSHGSLAGCLEALRRQSYRDFEVVVVDSSPDERTAEVAAGFPEVRFHRSRARMYPHAARNSGVELAQGELLVFSDPDVYADRHWLAQLVAAFEEHQQAVVGALACHGGGWLETGIHLCKFSKWLPGGAPSQIDMGPTANLLVPRQAFEAVGRFKGDHMLSDAWFSWELRQLGHDLRFAPLAVVAHHHLSSVGEFLRERFSRGIVFGAMRMAWRRSGRGEALLFLAVSALPLRLARVLGLVAMHCHRRGKLASFLRTLPVVVAGHAASLWGESVAYARHLLKPAARQPESVA